MSPLQWSGLASLLERTTGVKQANVFDVSRVFAFDAAPKNSISALLSKVRKTVRLNHADALLMSTVVDQNLGFTGQSYVAANWRRWCRVEPRPYLYLDEAYKTIRQLQDVHGEKRWEDLMADPTLKFEISSVGMLESLVFIQPLQHGSIGAYSHQDHYLKRQQ